jgi:hypothetical protein
MNIIPFKESFLLSEKVSNSEIKSVFNDPNIIVGIEYEFLLDEKLIKDEKYINEITNQYDNFSSQLEDFVDSLYDIGYNNYYYDYLKEICEKVLKLENLEKHLHRYDIQQIEAYIKQDMLSRHHQIWSILYKIQGVINSEIGLPDSELISPETYVYERMHEIYFPSVNDELKDFFEEHYGTNIQDNIDNLDWWKYCEMIYMSSKRMFFSDIQNEIFGTSQSPENLYEDSKVLNIEDFPYWDKLPFDDYEFGDPFGAYDTWFITTDASLPENGVEIISPTMSIKDALKYMKGMFDFIEKYGKTKYKTGLHVNMSYKGKHLRELDTLKLMLFMDEGFVWKYFPGRENNRYAESNFYELIRTIQNQQKDPELEQIADVLVDKYRNKVKGPNEKFFGINTSNEDRIEFRYLGGSGYHKKYDKIQTAIGKYAVYLKIGLDPKERQKEYILKLERLYNKYAKKETNSTKTIRDVPRIVLTQSHRIRLSDIDKYINNSPLVDRNRSTLRRMSDLARERGWNDVVFALIPNKSEYEKKLRNAGFDARPFNDLNLKDYVKGFEGTGSYKGEYLLYYYRK